MQLKFAAIQHDAMNTGLADADDLAFFLHALRAADGTNLDAFFTWFLNFGIRIVITFVACEICHFE